MVGFLCDCDSLTQGKIARLLGALRAQLAPESIPSAPKTSQDVRRPTMETFLVRKLPRFRGFFPWSFGAPRDVLLNLN